MRARRFTRPLAALATATLAASLLAGCAAFGVATPEQTVQERATERWKALIAGDLNKAYGYMAPSYRAVTSLERYSSSIGGVATWVGAEVIRVECATEKCTARLKIEAKPAATMHFKANITTGVDETWLLEDGQWWLFQKL